MALHTFLQIVDGLSQGSALFLVALGLSLTLGVMRLVNISNGAFYMLGAYVSTLAVSQLNISVWQMVLAISFGGVVAGLLTALRKVRPQNVRQFFALASQHMRWQLNDLARRLDEQPAAAALPETGVAAPLSSSVLLVWLRSGAPSKYH